MSNLLKIEQLVGDSFKILNGLPKYFTLEQKESAKIDPFLEKRIKILIEACSEWHLERIGVLLVRNSDSFEKLLKIILHHGFQHYSSKVEVWRDLQDLENASPFEWRSLDDPQLSVQQFKEYWRQCMIDSDNQASTLTMDEQLLSVKSELGKGWPTFCRVFYKNNKPIGVTIPHIEPGTINEGRLFYFGIFPEERGKGYSKCLHLQSLHFLKQMGATYYIGSTHIANKKMQRVFEKSGCSVKSYTEAYYKYF